MKNIFKIPAAVLLLLSMACNKFIEIPGSKNQIEGQAVFADSSSALAALLNTYNTLAAVNTRSKLLSLYADEYTFTGTAASTLEFSAGNISPTNSDNRSLWNDLYGIIYQSNAVIEGTAGSQNLSASTKKTLTAEAMFLRSCAYFYLLNLYDHIPLVLGTNVNENRSARQASPQLVYDQISSDLQQAGDNLSDQYQGSGKVRANRACTQALLARVYLYQKKWAEAEQLSSKVIASNQYSPLPKPEDTFLAGSREAILQLWTANGFLSDAAQVIPATAGSLPTYPLTTGFYSSLSADDLRKGKWTGTNTLMVQGIPTAYYYPAKYKNRAANSARPEYVMVLRLGEQYLIRAEARAQQNRTSEAVNDLNIIRQRAGLSPLPDNISFPDCLDAIAKERRAELFGEWGHRFFDLKRAGTLDQVIGAGKPAWKHSAAAFPIPFSEITYNRNLIQNDGY